MKEDLSLDELANMFSPSVREILLTKEEILRKGIASEPVLQFFIEQTNKTAEFQFVDILYVYMLEELLQSGEISLEEGKMVLQVLRENYEAMKHKTCDLIIVRKLGISTCLLVSNVDDLILKKAPKSFYEAIMKYTEALKLNCCSGGESMRTDNLIINGYGSSNGGEFHKVQLNEKEL